MDIHMLTAGLSVSGQLQSVDMAQLRRQGFASVINNRPDGEEEDQVSNASLAAAARAAGLAYRHIPVTMAQLGDTQAAAFATALASMPPPVLAFCGTGKRSTSLWALQADAPAPQILATARAAGYDLADIEPRLRRRESV